ncbi:MAG: phage tail protein [Proteobacteria bacterium]|nr:phage tail protein [Pseudomonadota bacterium]
MLKPASLREHLTAALPQLRRDPEKLVVFITGGGLHSTLTQSLSFEYRYTLRLLLLDYAGHADAVMAPLLIWLRTHQSDLLDNPEKRAKSVRFEAEHLSTTTMDLVIEIDLSEDVLARPREGGPPGALNLIHKDEPPPQPWAPWAPWPSGQPDPRDKLEHWEFWIHGDKVAEWDYDPR